jgi:tungstate transport system substrate-binding protein
MKTRLFVLIAGILLVLGLLGATAGCGQPAPTTVTVTPPTVTVTPTPTAAPKPANPQMILATTTSTRDTGLLVVLIPMFQSQTGYQVKTVAVGSGAAITMGQNGQADVLLVHSPDAELAFMATGSGLNRRLVMHNDFVIIGPPSDPAGIKGMTDPVAAMKKIADSRSLFVSRDDASGTNAYELSLWAQLGVTAKGQSWWISTGQGMGPTLIVASEKNGYTISDRGTYSAYSVQKSINSVIMVQNPPLMVNVYHVIQVNAAKFPNVTINSAGAQAFSDFMVSAATQAVIGQYGTITYNTALFYPDAGKSEATFPISILLVKGTKSKGYTLDQLKALTSSTGYAGTKNKAGTVSAPVNYTGVALADLLNTAGGFSSTSSVRVTASDGFTKTFTYAQVTGGTGLNCYDLNGNTATPSGTPSFLLAYKVNGQDLDTSAGPLQMVVLTGQNQVTDGSNFIKLALTIEIIAGQ